MGDELCDLLGSLSQIARGSSAPPVVRHAIDWQARLEQPNLCDRTEHFASFMKRKM